MRHRRLLNRSIISVACLVEGISPEAQTNIDKVQDFIEKLEKALKSQ